MLFRLGLPAHMHTLPKHACAPPLCKPLLLDPGRSLVLLFASEAAPKERLTALCLHRGINTRPYAVKMTQGPGSLHIRQSLGCRIRLYI